MRHPHALGAADLFRHFMPGRPPPADQCWAWRGQLDTNGHGYVRCGPDRHQAHRLAYWLFTGDIPDGVTVTPCRLNPSCVQPAHLGVHPIPRARINPHAKLDHDQVRAIRAADLDCKRLARLYGVTPRAIRDIKLGKTWRHVQ